MLKKQFIIKFSHVRTFFNMEKCKFSLGEVVWCKSPKSSNVWPAKIEVDKALGKWFREGKIFLVFYGQVKCQKGRWIELENVVPFNDITEKEMCGPPALAPAYKQAKEDFDKIAGDQPRKKTSLNEVGKSNVSTKTGGNVIQVSSKPAHKTNESRIEQGKSCRDVSVTASAPQNKKPQIKPVFTNEDETVVSRKIGANKLVAQEKTPITKRKHHNPVQNLDIKTEHTRIPTIDCPRGHLFRASQFIKVTTDGSNLRRQRTLVWDLMMTRRMSSLFRTLTSRKSAHQEARQMN